MEQTVQKQRVAVYCRVFAGSEDHPASLAAKEYGPGICKGDGKKSPL